MVVWVVVCKQNESGENVLIGFFQNEPIPGQPEDEGIDVKFHDRDYKYLHTRSIREDGIWAVGAPGLPPSASENP